MNFRTFWRKPLSSVKDILMKYWQFLRRVGQFGERENSDLHTRIRNIVDKLICRFNNSGHLRFLLGPSTQYHWGIRMELLSLHWYLNRDGQASFERWGRPLEEKDSCQATIGRGVAISFLNWIMGSLLSADYLYRSRALDFRQICVYAYENADPMKPLYTAMHQLVPKNWKTLREPTDGFILLWNQSALVV